MLAALMMVVAKSDSSNGVPFLTSFLCAAVHEPFVDIAPLEAFTFCFTVTLLAYGKYSIAAVIVCKRELLPACERKVFGLAPIVLWNVNEENWVRRIFAMNERKWINSSRHLNI